MTTPAPSFSSVGEYRESNRRMAESILTTEPAPYTDGGYVRRVLELRGRVSGQTHLVPIAVTSLAGSSYIALMKAPWAVAQFPFPADADRAQIEAAAAGVAVFRLDPDN